ncbi:MAG TPA: shikimate dehydrogenase [Labilithrix sp.]|jgi:shikimate dehydrogenase|nr:shikimate dehydrogenase [Labilithrix sp.]
MTAALRFAVIGCPVAHSKSPSMHEAAYRALGLPHRYEKVETTSEELPSRVDALRAGDFAGLNVTVPHKRAVLALVDEIDASARATGAANTLVRSEGRRVRAYNTDAPALRDELLRLAGDVNVVRDRSAIVFGTGGAARAAIFALGELRPSRMIVRARRRADELVDVLRASGSSAALTFETLDQPPSEPADVAAIVQATTAGMHGSGVAGEVVADAVVWTSVPADCVVYDVVYAPSRTALIARAEARGLAHDSGLGMLVRQGALAFQLWLGAQPPLDVMRAALG